MKSVAAAVISFVSVIATVQAQGFEIPRTLQDRLVQPSPEVSSCNRYIDTPVSYSTGTAEISIPLAGWNCGSIGISLGLSYHTEGIKVESPGSNVGLGWTLTGIGSVSRVINSMPDELAAREFDIRDVSNITDTDYLTDVIDGRTEANLDRYYYNLPDYSGSFIISTNGSVVQLPATELVITPSYDTSGGNGVYKPIKSFTILTPDGTTYLFDVTETTSYQYSGDSSPLSLSHDYNATTAWLLSKITDAYSNDEITIQYATLPQWSLSTVTNDDALGYHWSSDKKEGTISNNTGGVSANSSIGYVNQRLPLKISSRTASVEFTHRTGFNAGVQAGSPHTGIASFTLKDPSGKAVRTVTFDNAGAFSDGRQLLQSVAVRQGTVLIDKYIFTYQNPGSSSDGRDVFGFPNRQQYGGNSSILKENGELNSARKSHPDYVSDFLLTSIENVMGNITTYEYEPSRWIGNGNGGILGDTISIGSRIKSITATDRLTGRTRIREFTYSEPVLSADLTRARKEDFISLSGNISHTLSEGSLNVKTDRAIYSTLTHASRLPGFPVEQTRIFYKKVIEKISGTGMLHPVQTSYEYSVENCIHESVNANYYIPATLSSNKYLGSDYSFNYITDSSKSALLFSAKPIKSFFSEKIGMQPRLKKKTDFSWANGSFVETEMTEYFYHFCDAVNRQTGVFAESLVFSNTDAFGTQTHNIDEAANVNRANIYLYSARVLCDSTAVTRYFSNGGSRTITQSNKYSYSGIGLVTPVPLSLDIIEIPITDNNVWGDSVSVSPRESFRPISTTLSCGSDRIESHNLLSGDLKSGFFLSAKNRGILHLPIARKLIINDSDTIETHSDYACISSAGGMILPVKEYIMHNSQTVTGQRFTDYDSRGRLTGMVGTNGVKQSYSWNNYDELISASVPEAGLTTSFTHIPLVGCSGITAPDGQHRYFSYTGGRLSSERNTTGSLLKTYSYENFNESGANRISTTNYCGALNSTSAEILDGFGDAVQTIAVSAGGDGSNVISRRTLDALNRVLRSYSEFPSSATGYVQESEALSLASAYHSDAVPYNSCAYEYGGDSRKTALTGAGADFAGRISTAEHSGNMANGVLSCRRFTLDGAGKILTADGRYAASTLDVMRTTDADNHVSLTFTDWRNRTVLKRILLDADGTQTIDTYYIYDNLDNLRIVLQPEACDAIGEYSSMTVASDETLHKFAFMFDYDDRMRLVSRKIPGCEPETLIYDGYGNPVITQDGVQRKNGIASFILYDAAARPVVTGMCAMPQTTSISFPGTQFSADDSRLNGTGYSAPDWLTNPVVMTAGYYDTYDFLQLAAFDSISPKVTSRSQCRGHITGMLTAFNADYAVNIGNGAGRFIASAVNYDVNGFESYSISSTHTPGVFSEVRYTNNIQGNPTSITHNLTHPAGNHTDEYRIAYDRFGRVLTRQGRFDSGEWIQMESNSFNRIGNIGSVGGRYSATSFLYDVRGALKSLSNSFFTQTFSYASGVAPVYSGKISHISEQWGNEQSGYTFTYDAAGRLLSAVSGASDSFSRTAEYTYSKNSSPLTIKRRGTLPSTNQTQIIDNLSIAYDGNQLRSVSDSAPTVLEERVTDFNDGQTGLSSEYSYDENGRMTADDNRQISIQYSDGGFLQSISSTSGSFSFIYDAAGTKLGTKYSKTRVVLTPIAEIGLIEDDGGHGEINTFVSDNNLQEVALRDYYGGYEYTADSIGSGLGTSFDRLNTPWGFWDDKGNWHQFLIDYNSNVRVVLTQNAEGTTVMEQSTTYYPYGAPVAQSTGAETNRIKFSGKEFESRMDLNDHDFGPRRFNALVPLSDRPDRKAYRYHALSPYLLCADDPINHYDLTGDTLSLVHEGVRYYCKQNKKGEWYFDSKDPNALDYIDDLRGPGMLLSALDDLTNLKIGKKHVRYLNESNSMITIYPVEGSGDDKKSRFYFDDLSITFNYSRDAQGITETLTYGGKIEYKQMGEYICALGHEMAHAVDFLSGTYDSRVWTTCMVEGEETDIPRAEIYACNIENMIRTELETGLRHYYGLKSNVPLAPLKNTELISHRLPWLYSPFCPRNIFFIFTGIFLE